LFTIASAIPTAAALLVMTLSKLIPELYK